MLQRFDDHDGTQIGTADADVDDVRHRFARRAFPRTVPHGFGKGFHFFQNGFDLRHDVFAVDINGTVGTVAQRGVQNGAVFGRVNLFARKHRFARLFDAGFARQFDQQFHRVGGHAVFGIVHQQSVRRNGKFVEPFRIGGKHVAHFHAADFGVIGFQPAPGVHIG